MFDVTFLGVGATVGAGSFIFVGYFCSAIGPAFVLTNLFTAGIVFMSASALAARGLSMLIDELSYKWFSRNLENYLTFSSPYLMSHPDVVGCVISVCALAIVSFDVKTVSTINNFCCLTNLGLFLLITLVSGSNLNFENWNLPASEGCGNGGFFPFGIGSVFQGMSKVYISYLGFDSVANAGSEARDPERIIPLSMVVAVIILSVLFSLNSFTYTLVWSYCDQNIDDPIPQIMQKIGLDIMKWITSIGLPITMLGNFICNTYPLSRLVYAMAEDGLLCSYLAKIDQKTKSPIHALYTSGTFTALCVLFYSTVHLSQLACLGALSAYNLISYSLIYISYTDEDMVYGETERPFFDILFNKGELRQKVGPTVISSTIVRICCWFIFTSAFPYFFILKLGTDQLLKGDPLAIVAYVGFFVLYGTITYIIKCQPLGTDVPAKMSAMPLLPVLVILINTYLCLEYDIYTWMHGGIWVLVGGILYMTYGIWNSKAKTQSLYD